MWSVRDFTPSAQFTNTFRPNGQTSTSDKRLAKLMWLSMFLILWIGVKVAFISQPAELWTAFQHLWNIQALGIAIIESLQLYFTSLLIALPIAGLLAFSTVVPFFRPPVDFVTKLRFLSMAGLNLFVLIFVGSGETFKIIMMVFYLSVAILKSLVDTIDNIDKKYYDHARTIYTNEWAVSYEVIVKGKMADFIAGVKANQPAGWTMLFVVEAFNLSGGGVGGLMARILHHPVLAQVMVLLIMCVVAGLFIDLGLGLMRSKTCPYASLRSER